jgi:hypothetical protein
MSELCRYASGYREYPLSLLRDLVLEAEALLKGSG